MSVIRHQYDTACGREINEYVDSANIPDTIECACGASGCRGELSFNWGKMNVVAGEQTFSARYFKNREGKVIVAGTRYSQPPEGYAAYNTTSFHELQNLEKTVNRQAIEGSAYYREGLHRGYEAETARIGQSVRDATVNVIKEETTKLLQEQAANGDNVDYKSPIECPDARARFARDVMIAHHNNAPTKDFTKVDPGIKFEQLHNDASTIARGE